MNTNSGIIFLIGGLVMMRWVLCGLFIVLLSGCASRWEHATKRTSEFYDDDRDCQAQTGGATKGIDPGQERVSYESCMWQKGWHKKQSIWFFDPSGK
jgi:hypothetical protein